jgi:hypothetical protein
MYWLQWHVSRKLSPPPPPGIRDIWYFGATVDCSEHAPPLFGTEICHEATHETQAQATWAAPKQKQSLEFHLIVAVWRCNCVRLVMTTEITIVCCSMWRRVVWLTFTDVSTCNITQGPKQGFLSHSISIVGGIPTINTTLQMVCTFIDTLCKYTTCIMRSFKWCSRCYWSAVDCDRRATVVEVGWRHCCLEDCWECCSSLELARWGVLFS